MKIEECIKQGVVEWHQESWKDEMPLKRWRDMMEEFIKCGWDVTRGRGFKKARRVCVDRKGAVSASMATPLEDTHRARKESEK